MGNVFETETKVEQSKADCSYITAAEREKLQRLYASITTLSGTVEEINTSRLDVSFQLRDRPAFAAILDGYLRREVKCCKDFETWAVDCTRKTAASTLQSVWKMSSTSSPQSHLLFWKAVVELSLSTTDVTITDTTAATLTKFIDTVATVHGGHLYTTEGVIDVATLASLLNNYLPHTTKALETYFSSIFYGDLLSPSYRPYLAPQLSIPSEVATPEQMLPLSLHSESMQGMWKRLYSTSVDGQSFNRLVYHCLGYDGPTCILIRCAAPSNAVLAILAHDRWKESNRFYGSSKNALFVLSPKLRVYRSKGAGSSAFQWLNTKSVSLPRGMGFGGTVEGFRVFIPESLEGCIAANSCPTYETGKLVEGERFEIHTLELWGCGGSEAVAAGLKAQAVEREVTDENIRKARHVDKAQFFNNEFDKEFFLSGTTSHREHERAGNA